jgi:hypothetical protein
MGRRPEYELGVKLTHCPAIVDSRRRITIPPWFHPAKSYTWEKDDEGRVILTPEL